MTALIVLTFLLGYLAIALEHTIKVNKAASALITGVLCWTFYIISSGDKEIVNEQLISHLGDLSGILFFLLGAMVIVELIDAHYGFNIITSRITQTDKRKLLWIVSFITFFLSALLDNLTTTIVIISLLRKLIKDKEDRLFFVGVVVIAANAGGAWSPIGDVTTTMLWIGNQVTTANIIKGLLVPSLVCLIVPLIFLSFKLKGTVTRPEVTAGATDPILPKHQQLIVFCSGVCVLLMVPVFKTATHLPPYMSILLGLGILWMMTEIIHVKKLGEDKDTLSVATALRRIDSPSILFFLGILLSIAALESTGVLGQTATWLTAKVSNINTIIISIGLLSSIVDNVPLVAAVQRMFDLSVYPTDHYFWQFLAYCSGTGGSALIIGSAAGVAAMGMEKVNFLWYVKRITLLALLGYFAGALTFILQNELLGK
jgi:Na+/H+ antiporter NhaD/arsenite permease-like protein